MGEIENLDEISKKIHNAIFSDKEQVKFETADVKSVTRPVEKFSKSGLRNVKYSGILFVEQNPEKDSAWAEKSRNGEEITWLIKGGDYIGRVYKGKFVDFR